MMPEGWRYYNHAAIPTCAPHETPDITPVDNGLVFRSGEGQVLFARWSSDWDLNHPTGWWYVIKDTPFDIMALKSNRRGPIRKGQKHFDVRTIDPEQYRDDLFRVTLKAYEGWPEKYRPIVTKEAFIQSIYAWNNQKVYGAFSKTDGALYGYFVMKEHEKYAAGSLLRSDPEQERFGINAAIMAGILEDMNDKFGDGFYFSNGERAIRHETNFQDYLEKNFGFRKAYCTLNIRYRAGFGLLVKILYPFRRLFNGRTSLGSRIAGVLKMEEIIKQQRQMLQGSN